MASLYRFRGLMVIALWQVTPVGVDEYGRTRVGFGLGAGTMQFANYSCDGTLIDAETVGYRTAAVEAEHWFVPGKLRAHSSLGYQWSDSLSMKGPMGALMLSYDGRRFGIGAGPGFVQDRSYSDGPDSRQKPTVEYLPSMYLRVGNRDNVHVRGEFFPPSVQAGGGRVVVGYNMFDPRRPSFAFGVGAFGWEGGTASGAVMDYFHPVSPTTALGFSGYAGPGENGALLGVTVRARMTLK